MSAWSLLNLLCAAWAVCQGVLGSMIVRERHAARAWLPNRAGILLDMAGGALAGFAAASGVGIAVLSLILGGAWLTGSMNLIASGGLGLVLVASLAAGRPRLPELIAPAARAPAPSGDVVVLAGGDVAFDSGYEIPRVVRNSSPLGTLAESLTWLGRRPEQPTPRLNLDRRTGQLQKEFVPIEAPGDDPGYPLAGIRPLLADADVCFVNLESPLAERRRGEGYRLTSRPAYAQALRDAGVDVVNFANNHAFDAEATGFAETLALLDKAGIACTGAGRDLAQARAGAVTETNGLRIAWLGYTQKMGRVTLDYAVPDEQRGGCLPLDPYIVRDDIRAARERADVVIVTPHWGVEGRDAVSGAVRRLARWMIDAGADAVLGHGPHLYQGIEVHKRRPIAYSMGTLVFGIYDKSWRDNTMVRLHLKDGVPARLEVIPVAGTGDALFRPAPLQGAAARQVLEHLAGLSRALGTHVSIEGDRGVVEIG